MLILETKTAYKNIFLSFCVNLLLGFGTTIFLKSIAFIDEAAALSDCSRSGAPKGCGELEIHDFACEQRLK